MSDHVVTFAEWDSGRTQLTDEIFDPVFDVYWPWVVVGYVGRETGTRLGLWFGEVMQHAGEGE